ncbi:CdaR family protein [Sporolactobacillus shoreicorticis]|uniref:YbbR-like domain-containing protein n=1 Tax=Sporolactobacillus shoreicorticis TaxID=1923877 RepID=A0ABW5S4I7_9BACL|nr:CdaR family protein [Sporolactobacillus shoreicorticis]MCO7125304.1 CdaR family protein [Sporolactobacillus shoreicorticis]
MDKLLNNNWFVKIVSFVMALMLYAIVSSGDGTSSGSPSNVAVNPSQQSAVVTQKLTIQYNQNKYVVSGAPQTISIRLTGSNESILKAKLPSTKSAYLDLRDMKPGTYDARVQTRGFPSGLTVRPTPKTVRVTIQKKTSKELPVAIDIINKNSVADGYSVGDPVIDTQNVTVTGGEDSVDSIAFIKGVINVKDANTTVDKMVTLHAFNSNGDQVNVTVHPSSVHVRVPIGKVSKQLSIKAVSTGTPAKGYSVSSIETSAKDVTVTAQDAAALSQITALDPLSVSVDGLKKDKTFSVTIPVPSGASKVTPEKIDVTVHIVKEATAESDENSSSDFSSSSSSSSTDEQTKKLTNIPIKVTGLKDGLKATFSQEDHVNVSITGPSQEIDQLSESDIQAQVDLSGMDAGEHQVTVAVNTSDGLTAKADPKTVSVSIS